MLIIIPWHINQQGMYLDELVWSARAKILLIYDHHEAHLELTPRINRIRCGMLPVAVLVNE